MPNLWLDAYLPELAPGCCPNKVYALVFNRAHQALKDVGGTGVRTFFAFSSAAQNDFGIILAEHAQRTRYYYVDLAAASFSMVPSPANAPYYLEIWRRELAGTFDRAVDILEQTRELIWTTAGIANAELGATDTEALANYQAHVAAGYNSETLTLYFMAHLDRNGALVVNAPAVQVRVRDRAGNVVMDVSQSVYMTGVPGVFQWDQGGVTLQPDQVYVVEAVILDAFGASHKTISYLNTWD